MPRRHPPKTSDKILSPTAEDKTQEKQSRPEISSHPPSSGPTHPAASLTCPPYPRPPAHSHPTYRVHILPLQEMPGEFSPVRIQVAFSLQDLKQIKRDSGKFSDDPYKYIEPFQNLTQVFELSWKDTMLILNQTLTSSEKQVALQAAEQFGDDQFLVYHDEQTG